MYDKPVNLLYLFYQNDSMICAVTREPVIVHGDQYVQLVITHQNHHWS